MDILPSKFSDELVGLEAPPEDVLPDTSAGAADGDVPIIVVTVCPSCGCKDPAVLQDEVEGTMACPQCQCGYGSSSTEPTMALESSARHVLSYLQSRQTSKI